MLKQTRQKNCFQKIDGMIEKLVILCFVVKYLMRKGENQSNVLVFKHKS